MIELIGNWMKTRFWYHRLTQIRMRNWKRNRYTQQNIAVKFVNHFPTLQVQIFESEAEEKARIDKKGINASEDSMPKEMAHCLERFDYNSNSGTGGSAAVKSQLFAELNTVRI